ncbi:hypothetical protein D3C75_1243840 [compost metagenome]
MFNPLLIEGGALSSTVGSIIGVGPGRGIALLFIIGGVLVVIMAAITSRLKPIKLLEQGMEMVPAEPVGLMQD